MLTPKSDESNQGHEQLIAETNRICKLIAMQQLIDNATSNAQNKVNYSKSEYSGVIQDSGYGAIDKEVAKRLGNHDDVTATIPQLWKDCSESYFTKNQVIVSLDELKNYIETLKKKVKSDFIEKTPKNVKRD